MSSLLMVYDAGSCISMVYDTGSCMVYGSCCARRAQSEMSGPLLGGDAQQSLFQSDSQLATQSSTQGHSSSTAGLGTTRRDH
eukprot:gene9755-biopygen2528